MTVDADTAPKFCPQCGASTLGDRFCSKCGADLVGASPASGSAASTNAPGSIAWGGAVILIAGALAVLGSFLPWITATAAFVGTISRSGIDGGGDGMITIALGILVGLFGIALVSRNGNPSVARLGAAICGVVMGWVTITDFGSVSDRLKDLETDFSTGSVGMGLYVVGLAAALAIIGSLLAPPKRS
jgi:hypothetical protein